MGPTKEHKPTSIDRRSTRPRNSQAENSICRRYNIRRGSKEDGFVIGNNQPEVKKNV